jgi:hypothetical protein
MRFDTLDSGFGGALLRGWGLGRRLAHSHNLLRGLFCLKFGRIVRLRNWQPGGLRQLNGRKKCGGDRWMCCAFLSRSYGSGNQYLCRAIPQALLQRTARRFRVCHRAALDRLRGRRAAFNPGRCARYCTFQGHESQLVRHVENAMPQSASGCDYSSAGVSDRAFVVFFLLAVPLWSVLFSTCAGSRTGAVVPPSLPVVDVGVLNGTAGSRINTGRIKRRTR